MHRILLVEDDAEIRLTISEVLEEEGYGVVAAADGHEAIEQLKRTRPLPRLILLDLMMPGMDGVQFRAEQMKMDGCTAIPFIVLSADARTREVARDLGAHACLRKPVDLGELLDTLARVCEQ